MAEVGFLYVLINPSMPGLVKIGKTTRDPDERVAELSGATGVPTPFLLIYSTPVADCDAAEACAHALLEQRRLASNREFFACKPTEAINVVLQVSGMPVSPSDVEAGGSSSEVPSSADRKQTGVGGSAASLADDIFQQALSDYEGRGAYGTDFAAAFEGFRKASKLGHAMAIRYVGECYEYGRGVKGDARKAYSSYKEASLAGDAAAIWPMVRMHCRSFGSSNEWEASQLETRLTAIRLLEQHVDRIQGGYRVLFNEIDTVSRLLNPKERTWLHDPIDTERFLPAATALANRLFDLADKDGQIQQLLESIASAWAAEKLSAVFYQYGRQDWARRAFLVYLALDDIGPPSQANWHRTYKDEVICQGSNSVTCDDRLRLFNTSRYEVPDDQRHRLRELLVSRYRTLRYNQELLMRILKQESVFPRKERGAMLEAMRARE